MNTRVVLHAALAALVLTAPAPALAQDGPAEFKSEPLVQLLDELAAPAVVERRIATQLSACLQPLYENGLDYAPIILETQLDASGRPSEPRLLDPAPSQAARPHMRQLLRAEMALFDCAPISVEGAPITDVRLAFAVEGDKIRIAASAEVTAATIMGVADVVASTRSLSSSPDTVPAGLTLDQRREAQVRLSLSGVDPGDPDGVFGPRTLDAISQWQQERGYRATGELTQAEIDTLWDETQTDYQVWARTAGILSQNSQQQRTPTVSRFYQGQNGCLRSRLTDRIVLGQSRRCDGLGIVQSF